MNILAALLSCLKFLGALFVAGFRRESERADRAIADAAAERTMREREHAANLESGSRPDGDIVAGRLRDGRF